MQSPSGFFTAVDEIQLAKARRGDLEALEGLYRMYAGPVANLASRLCSSVHETEEVVQETFLETVRSLSSYRGDGAFGAWLRRIAVSKALTAQRSRRKLTRGGVNLEAGANATVEPAAATDGSRGWHRVDVERALATPPREARLMAGDVVIAWSGETLTAGEEDPRLAAVAAAREVFDRSKRLEQGDTVTLRFLRDGTEHDVTLTGEVPDTWFHFEYRFPGPETDG